MENYKRSKRRSLVRKLKEYSVLRKEKRTCYGCGKVGNVKADHRAKNNDITNGGRQGRGGGNIVLAIFKGTINKNSRCAKLNQTLTIGDKRVDIWILDSGDSRHLVNEPSLLQDSKTCEHECHLADGELVKLRRVGNVVLNVIEEGH